MPSFKHQFFIYALLCFLFFLSSFQIVSVVAVIVLFVCSLFCGQGITSFKTVFKDKVLLSMVAFYLLHALSVLYSSNLAYALFDLRVKLPFLIVPFIFSSVALTEDDWKKIKKAFVYGCSFAALWCMASAYIQYQKINDFSAFFYESFSKFLHPAYFSIFLNLAVLFSFDDWLQNRVLSRRDKWLLAASLLINLFTIRLLMSRTAIVVFIFSAVVMIIFAVKQQIIWGRIKWMIGALVFFLVLLIFTNERFNRFTVVNSTVSGIMGSTPHQEDKKGENAVFTRLLIWKEALKVIAQNPVIGVGCGDIKDELVKQYQKDDYTFGVEQRLNPHNQYLHTAVSLGVIGLLSLCMMLLLPLFIALTPKSPKGDFTRSSIRRQGVVYALFLLIILLNCLTESILERQAGVLFFCVFNCLFYFKLKQATEAKP